MTDPDSSQGPLGDASSPSSTPEPVAEEPAAAPVLAHNPSQAPPLTPTRASGFWAAVVIGLLVLVLLSVFILENQQRASVSFFGVHGHLPEGVALLLAAVIGGLFVVIAAVARILELRSHAVRPQTKSRRMVTRKGRARANADR
jgi:uncharacterized integral membrane protein